MSNEPASTDPAAAPTKVEHATSNPTSSSASGTASSSDAAADDDSDKPVASYPLVNAQGRSLFGLYSSLGVFLASYTTQEHIARMRAMRDEAAKKGFEQKLKQDKEAQAEAARE
ncbi:uncharacterized protein RHOBADRAFT_40783 [Rhodotorula graminis WP1]|uniref:Uncharacterized protein n=1 Tax=Rhodotorula graminis (strain WP1) TaxID=578459 RepID=A0A194SCR2_RHOGW|nr:uncharacterized protein RHOBADRAFT_40783 [Rhodotorula graminis WP1]KPV78235.1 hypothetical protein RHOBADRAFT_40783 [Rhodotorula graminis WP1]